MLSLKTFKPFFPLFPFSISLPSLVHIKILPLPPLRSHPLFARQAIPLPPPHPFAILAHVAGKITHGRRRLAEKRPDPRVATPVRGFAVGDKLLETLGVAALLGFSADGGTAACAAATAASPSILGDAVGNAVTFFARIEQDAAGGFAVPAGAAGFLVVSFETLREAPVHDEADVLLVDAHAERGGGDDDVIPGLVGDPRALAGCAVQRGEARVVGDGADGMRAEAGRQHVAVGAEGDVDDPRHGGGSGACCCELKGSGRIVGAAVVDGLQPG